MTTLPNNIDSNSLFITTQPNSNQEARNSIFQGKVLHLSSTASSRLLVDTVYELLYKNLGQNPRKAERTMSESDFFRVMGAIRKELYTSSAYHQLLRDCIADLGFDNEHVAFDPLRLRIINHDGHENPLAAPVYYPHRDIWYGHPASLITWWIPLDDLLPEETFYFYPDKFQVPVPNSSHIFDYQTWVSKGWDLKIGWQRVAEEDRLQYPGVIGDPERGTSVGFSCTRGDNILFAGAHFHATRPQSLHKTRFSLDFRVVDLRDIETGNHAPSVDDNSTGKALVDYIQPGQITWTNSTVV